MLVATDAAGEGLNLQRAHLMVNYDPPWNPNRIEQRFGRIHRIGQEEVCHLWNLVAADTREGQVFITLLNKVEEQRKAYGRRIIDVLGEAFTEQPLSTLLMDAVRYGDDPQTKARLDEIVDVGVSRDLDALLSERALSREVLDEADVQELRLRLEEARARRLQPRCSEAFALAALRQLGGMARPREAGRWQITHVPGDVRARDRVIGRYGAPVLPSYERVTFDTAAIKPAGQVQAALLAPGHPLLDSRVDLVRDRHSSLLKQGTVLIDRSDLKDEPRLLVAVTQEITDGALPARPVLRRFGFVELTRDGGAADADPAPYLDYDVASERELQHGRRARRGLAEHRPRVARPRLGDRAHARHAAPAVARSDTRPRQQGQRAGAGAAAQRDQLLGHQVRHPARRSRRRPQAADQPRDRAKPRPRVGAAPHPSDGRARRRGGTATAAAGARGRGADHPAGAARPHGRGGERATPGARAGDRAVERRAVEAVLAAERALGREPHEMPHNNKGYDILSLDADEHLVWIEVKGRVAGAEDFTITVSEVLFAQQNGPQHRLALVEVGDDPAGDWVRYLVDAFADEPTPGFGTTSSSRPGAATGRAESRRADRGASATAARARRGEHAWVGSGPALAGWPRERPRRAQAQADRGHPTAGGDQPPGELAVLRARVASTPPTAATEPAGPGPSRSPTAS